MSSLFILFLVVATSSAARFYSWAEVSSLPQIQKSLDETQYMCKRHEKIHNAYIASLFCEANDLELFCQADMQVIQKLVSNRIISEQEISDICQSSNIEDQGRKLEKACQQNKWTTLAILICSPATYEKTVDELTKFSMETSVTLPISLEQLKSEQWLTAAQKERIMRVYLRYHPRYIWGVFIARETQ